MGYDIRQTRNFNLNRLTNPMIQSLGRKGEICVNQNGNVIMNESVQSVTAYYNDPFNSYGELTPQIINEIINNPLQWNNIKALHNSSYVTYGITYDGQVFTAGTWYMRYQVDGYNYNEYMDMHLDTWLNISDISIGNIHVIGLRNDGKVVASGLNLFGECNVGNWNDIIQVSTGNACTFGLKSNGTVLYTGKMMYGMEQVSRWQDIVSIHAGNGSVFGIKSDGTIVVAGSLRYGEERFNKMVSEITKWKDIIAVDYDSLNGIFIGLQSNGDILMSGEKNFTLRPLKGQNIIAVNLLYYGNYYALKDDGTIVKVKSDGIYPLNNIRIFNDSYSFEELMKKNIENGKADAFRIETEIMEMVNRKQAGVCIYCGGSFKGLFSKKCRNCGKPKNY